MEDLRDLLDIQNDDAHRVLADCEDEMAVYNAIRNGVKSRRAFCGTAAPSREPTGQPGQSGPGSPGRIPTISPLDHQCVR